MSDISNFKVGANTYDIKDKESRANILAIVNEYGAKNLSPIKDISGTQAGLTVTMNSDGSITFHAGTSTNTSNAFIYLPGVRLIAGQYYYSGGLPTSFNDKIVLLNHSYGPVNESDYLFTADGSSNYSMTILIRPQITLSQDVTFYPMIRDARITDGTYVPYAMTNRELTDAVNRGSVSVISDGVKTFTQLLNDLFALIDLTRVSYNSCLLIHKDILSITEKENAALGFGMSRLSEKGNRVDDLVYLHTTNSMIYEYVNGTKTDYSATVLSSGVSMSFYY